MSKIRHTVLATILFLLSVVSLVPFTGWLTSILVNLACVVIALVAGVVIDARRGAS